MASREAHFTKDIMKRHVLRLAFGVNAFAARALSSSECGKCHGGSIYKRGDRQ